MLGGSHNKECSLLSVNKGGQAERFCGGNTPSGQGLTFCGQRL